MQFSNTILAALLLTVTSVAGVAVPVPAPSPVTLAQPGALPEPDKVLDIVPRQSTRPPSTTPIGGCTFGSYTCSGNSIVSLNKQRAKKIYMLTLIDCSSNAITDGS
jgi:hypothetical protein